MIRLRAVTLSRGGRNLIDNADASIAPGDKLAIIGPNGSGKTTLMRALCGELLPDRGELDMPPMQLVMLEQQAPTSSLPAWQYVVASDPTLVAAQQALDQASQADDGLAIAHALDDWQQAGGDNAAARAHELLHGLGFDDMMAGRAVNELSGGWRMRLNLAAVLFRPSDLLLLDEPTNHLDLDAILWLEKRLRRYPGTLLVVSHDRDFLDAIVDGTLAIENGELRRYRGGYSACETQRAERALNDQRSADQTRRQAEHLRQFIDRFRAQANKARQVQSRIKAMERLQIAAPLAASRHLRLTLDDVGSLPNPIMVCESVAAGYGDTPILTDINLVIERGTRIGILGRNGQGKTTLIRTLIGQLAPLSGQLRGSPSVRIGCFAQDAVEHLRADDSALDHLRRETLRHLSFAPPDSALRSWLGRFAFAQEDAIRPVGPMSGGERARLVLAMVLWSRPQWLILDEPTNHLDSETRDALTEALIEFNGVLLVVSHDRYLLRACVDRFVLVGDARVRDFDGDLDDYARYLQDGQLTSPRLATAESNQVPTSGPDRKAQRREQADQRQAHAARLAPLRKQISEIESRLARLSRKLAELDERLALPATYDDKEALAWLNRERAELASEQESLEGQWLETAQLLENAQSV